MTMIYDSSPEFKLDLKKLLKKFATLNDDLKTAKKNAIELKHTHKIDNQSVFQLQGYQNNYGITFWKIKKFTCKSLKNKGAKSGIRVIYALQNHKLKVDFLEIYYKADKDNEDANRIRNFLMYYEPSNPKLEEL